MAGETAIPALSVHVGSFSGAVGSFSGAVAGISIWRTMPLQLFMLYRIRTFPLRRLA